MRTYNFFNANLTENKPGIVLLSAEETHHANKVLRISRGDAVKIFNGRGVIASGKFVKTTDGGALIEIERIETAELPEIKIIMGFGMIKSRERIEWMIEKAVELGVSEIWFVITRNAERTKINGERLQKVAISAMKQSGNPYLPLLKTEILWNEFLSSMSLTDGCKWIADCHMEKKTPLGDDYIKSRTHIILIGPEGGFEKTEIDEAVKEGFRRLSLGRNILRAETAAIYSISLINTLRI